MIDIRAMLNRTKNNTSVTMKEKYKELLRKYHNLIFNKVADVIYYEIRGVSNYRIGEWVDNLLMFELKRNGQKKLDKILSTLETKTNHIINGIESQTEETSILIKQYEEELNIIANQTSQYWLDEIINEFKISLRRKLFDFCVPFNGYSQHSIEYNIDKVCAQIKPELTRIMIAFEKEYNQIIKTEIHKNINKVRELTDGLGKNIQVDEEEIKKFSKMLEYSGFNLLKKNGRLFAQNLKREEIVVELKYNKQEKTLTSIDNNLTFTISGDNFYLITNRKENIYTLIGGNSIFVRDYNKRLGYEIFKEKDHYDFYYYDHLVNHIEEIKIVIDYIKNVLPKYYNKLLEDPNFQVIVNEIEKHQEEIKEIFCDKTDGKLKINPQTRNLVIKKLRLLGFSPIEREDGLYLQDLKTQEEYKMLNEYTCVNLNKNIANKIELCTNINFEGENISLHNICMKKQNSWINISNELSLFKMTIGEKQYRVELTQTGMVCQTKTEYTNVRNISEQELMSSIKDEFPFVTEYFEQHLSTIRRKQEVQSYFSNDTEQKNITETSQQPSRKR